MRPTNSSYNSGGGGGGGAAPRSPVSYTHSPYRTSLLAVDGGVNGSGPSSPLSPHSGGPHEGSGRASFNNPYQLPPASATAMNSQMEGSATEPRMSSPIQVAAPHVQARQRRMPQSPTLAASAGHYSHTGSPGNGPSSPMSLPPRSPSSNIPEVGSHNNSSTNNPYRVNMYGSSAPAAYSPYYQQQQQQQPQQQQQRTSPLGTPMQHRQNSGSGFGGQRPPSGTSTPKPSYPQHFSPPPPPMTHNVGNSYAPAGFGGPQLAQQGSGNYGGSHSGNAANLSRSGSYDRRAGYGSGGGGSQPRSPLVGGSTQRRDPYNMSGGSPFNRSTSGQAPSQQPRGPRSPASYNSGQGFLQQNHTQQQQQGSNDGHSLASSLQTGRSFSTALDDTVDIASAQSCSSASSVRDDLPLCPTDEACAEINDRKHQRKYAHTCRLFPCYHGHIKRHAKLFRHAPGQIAVPEGTSTTKMSTLALASVNFSSISPEAPNAYRIYVSRGDKSYEIFGDWASTKVHTFKRYLHQVYHIPPQSQVLVVLRTNKPMDDEIMSVRSYGIEEDSVIQLKSDAELAPSRIPLDDL